MALNIPFSQAEGKVGVDDTVQYFESVSMGFIFFPFLYLSILDPEMSKHLLYVVQLNLRNLKLDGWLFVPKCHVSSCIVKKKKEKKMMPLNNVLHIVFGNIVQLLYCYW